MATVQAVLYLRSSKDRKDVSPAAQRRELTALARERGCVVVEEFVDVVVSGKSEHRPGFQALLRGLSARDRTWTAIFILDTARLARNQYVAHFFRHECKRRGVDVVYAKTPEMDGIAGILLPAILHASDEVHSYLSKEKGLAGMAENVRSGFRAGGAAPRGYRLKKIPTGAVRDGEAVTKSVLEPDAIEGPKMAAYMAARADGMPRAHAAEHAGLGKVAATTLIGMEWNALTYAGHTVWNVHHERDPGGGYVGGTKRKPRKDWMIQRNTHPPMITEDQAEAILQKLESSKHGPASHQRARLSEALLGGLVFTPAGEKWWGYGGEYRYKSTGAEPWQRSIKSEQLESIVLERIVADIGSPAFANAIVDSARAKLDTNAEGEQLAQQEAALAAVTAKISRTMDLAAELAEPGPALRKIDELEGDRAELAREVDRLREAAVMAKAYATISHADVEAMLASLADELRSGRADGLRPLLASVIDRVVVDPETLAAALHYRLIPDAGVRVASPRGFEPRSLP